MGGLRADFDRVSEMVLLTGLALGALWVAEVRVGAPLAVLAVALGVLLCLLRGRWLEAGLLMAATGIVPAVTYFAFGNPPLPRGDEPSIALFVPGAALVLTVIGFVAVAWSSADAVGHRRGGRARQEARNERRRNRLAQRGP